MIHAEHQKKKESKKDKRAVRTTRPGSRLQNYVKEPNLGALAKNSPLFPQSIHTGGECDRRRQRVPSSHHIGATEATFFFMGPDSSETRARRQQIQTLADERLC